MHPPAHPLTHPTIGVVITTADLLLLLFSFPCPAGGSGDTTAQWVPSNPNTLNVNLDLSTLPTPTSMLAIEEKVTKRAVEQDLPPGNEPYI